MKYIFDTSLWSISQAKNYIPINWSRYARWFLWFQKIDNSYFQRSTAFPTISSEVFLVAPSEDLVLKITEFVILQITVLIQIQRTNNSQWQSIKHLNTWRKHCIHRVLRSIWLAHFLDGNLIFWLKARDFTLIFGLSIKTIRQALEFLMTTIVRLASTWEYSYILSG